MPDLKFEYLKDGRIVLPSNADPAAAGCTVFGWKKHSVGLDLGRNVCGVSSPLICGVPDA